MNAESLSCWARLAGQEMATAQIDPSTLPKELPKKPTQEKTITAEELQKQKGVRVGNRGGDEWLGKEAVRGLSMPVPNSTVAQTSIVFGGVKAMLVRSREEGDARGIDDDRSAVSECSKLVML
jgi:hypothetical protein